MALNALLPKRPALLLSGINRGSNVGDDVHYSGTAAAALEGGLQGIPSLAVSLDVDWARSPDSYQWECAAEIASEVISTMLKRNVPGQTVLNLNVPDLPRGDIRGVKVCRLGSRIYEAKTSHGEDLRWQPYYWIGTVHMGFRPIPNSDGPLLKDGYATLTPLSIDLTDNATLERMSTWELG
jgi:5'-nucleotidase